MGFVDMGAGVGMGAMRVMSAVRTVVGRFPKSFLGVELNKLRYAILQSNWGEFTRRAMVTRLSVITYTVM
jgi:hypothetical protein